MLELHWINLLSSRKPTPLTCYSMWSENSECICPRSQIIIMRYGLIQITLWFIALHFIPLSFLIKFLSFFFFFALIWLILVSLNLTYLAYNLGCYKITNGFIGRASLENLLINMWYTNTKWDRTRKCPLIFATCGWSSKVSFIITPIQKKNTLE